VERKGFVLVGLLVLAVIVGGLILTAGWGLNIYKLTQCDFAEPYKAEVIRGVGIALPFVGSVAGWMDIDDTPAPEQE